MIQKIKNRNLEGSNMNNLILSNTPEVVVSQETQKTTNQEG